MRERRKHVPREHGHLGRARPLARSDDGRQRPPSSHAPLDEAAYAVVGPVDVEEALEARDVRVAAQRAQGRGLALGEVEGLPASDGGAGAAAAQARRLEGELSLLGPSSFRFFAFFSRLFVADGKGHPEGAAAEDGLDAVPAVDEVPRAEGVAVGLFLFARGRRRRRRRRRRGRKRGRSRSGDLSPRPLEGDGRGWLREFGTAGLIFRGRVGVVVALV